LYRGRGFVLQLLTRGFERESGGGGCQRLLPRRVRFLPGLLPNNTKAGEPARLRAGYNLWFKGPKLNCQAAVPSLGASDFLDRVAACDGLIKSEIL
jgi:hypothetical protein